ncbi:phosphoribosylanthranilate isomerase [Daejeonella oryzae]|uniref:phosphoribosylanthranilate isomerase n=1 Tax=Daejeonella oryzae TaxID=1122943 RepID=UPI0004291F7D|nr:phosphoribosylanthranilate isomerase [Daejeonella oryzae]
MKIKVCGMRDSSNIRDLIELKPDYLGLIFYPGSKRYLETLQLELVAEVSQLSKITGVFVNEQPEIVNQKIQLFKLKAVQLHGNESPAYCHSIKMQNPSVELIKAFGIDEDFNFSDLEPFLTVTDFFLFDTKSAQHGGSGKTFDWNVLKQYSYQKPYFLSGGIGLENLDEVLTVSDNRLYAVDLNSRFETEPGFKNIGKLKLAFNKLNPVREQEDI